MASMADLVLAKSDAADEILSSEYPLNHFRGVNIDGLDPLMLSALHAQVTGSDLESAIELYRPIKQAADTGPWLVQVSPDLIEALGHIPPEDIPQASAKWADTPTMQQAGWSTQDAEQYLGQVHHFSQTAAFEQIELFLVVYS